MKAWELIKALEEGKIIQRNTYHMIGIITINMGTYVTGERYFVQGGLAFDAIETRDLFEGLLSHPEDWSISPDEG